MPKKAKLMKVSARGIVALSVCIIGCSPFLKPAVRGNVRGDTEGSGERGCAQGNWPVR